MADQIKLILEADPDGTYWVAGAEDTRGNAIQVDISIEEDAGSRSEPDTEGHMAMRGKGHHSDTRPVESHGRPAPPTDLSDDVEGHVVKIRLSVPSEADSVAPDVDGHAIKRSG